MQSVSTVSKYNDVLYRIILTPDGTAIAPESNKPIKLAGVKGLDVTQAPDGSLIELSLSNDALYLIKPDEAPSVAVAVKSVFPWRGGKAGGTTLTVHGVNLNKNGATPTVTAGGSSCAVQSFTAKVIKCVLPGGSGTVDIVVTVGAENYTFEKGYRYINGI